MMPKHRLFAFALFSAVAAAVVAPGCGSTDSPEDGTGRTQEALEQCDGTAGSPDGASDAHDDAPSCRAATLVASRSYRPTRFKDGTASFSPPMRLPIPAVIPVTVGNAGNREIVIRFHRDGEDDVPCRYRGGAAHAHPTTPSDVTAGQEYLFEQCDGPFGAGDVIPVSGIFLRVDNGDDKDPSGETEVTWTFEEDGCADGGRDAAADGAADGGTQDAAIDATDAAPEASSDGSIDAAADASEAGDDAADAAAAIDAATCTTASCDDHDPCTTDTCNPDGTCSHAAAADGTACDDGNACTQTDTCQSGKCAGSNPVTCTASDQCHAAGTCNPTTGTCSNPIAANGTSCNDGNACTQSDTCQNGTCTGTNPVTCAASDQCHVAGICNPTTGTCTNPVAANGTSCNDGNACTQADACESGVCTGQNPVTCAAQDQCHVAGVCDPSSGACSNPPAANGTPCTDGNACTQTDACQAGTCMGTNPVVCAASDACHFAGICDPASGACSNPAAPDGTACVDGNACTQTDTCVAGTCTGTNPVTCTAQDQCHDVGTCDPATGSCSNPAKVDGTACTDGNACTVDDTCRAGACASGTPLTCTASDRCHAQGTCDPTSGTCSNPALPNCDPAPTAEGNAFETHASLLGKVVGADGSPFAGYTVTVYDAPAGPGATPRTDLALTTGTDGSFRAQLTTFPTSEPDRSPPHHLVLHVDSPSTLTAIRDAYLHPGGVVDLGPIMVVARDSKVTTIDGSGGVATDSQGLIEIDFPAGALSGPTPIRITPFRAREALPYPLPDVTITTYAMVLEPDGLTFPAGAQPTVRVANWRNYPTTLHIPVGSADTANGRWQHEGTATWDGKMFAFKAAHFSLWDVNPSNVGEWVISFAHKWLARNQRKCGWGSSVGVGNGTLTQSIAIPGYRRADRAYGVALNYDSFLTFGSTSTTTSGGVPQVTPIRVGTEKAGMSMMCLPKPQADHVAATTPGSCTAGSCTGGLTIPSGFAFSVTSNNQETTTNLDAGGADDWVDDGVDLPGDGSTVVPPFWANQTVKVVNIGGGGCAGDGSGAFGSSGSGGSPTPVPNPGAPTPIASEEHHVFVGHRHGSPYGTGWALEGVGHLYRDPTAFNAVLLTGSGNEEHFAPRATSTVAENNGAFFRPLAADPTTGETFEAWDSTIARLDLATGKLSTVYTGALVNPQAMAITYVGGVRHFLVAGLSALTDVDAAGNARVLKTRAQSPDQGVAPFAWLVPGVAASGEWAFYVEGYVTNPVLYRFHLTDAAPAAEALSLPLGAATADASLDPKAPVSGVVFGDPHGLVVGQDGILYVADRQRHVVYGVRPDGSNVIASDSPVFRAIGDGVGQTLSEVGYAKAGPKFSINQPILLSLSPDGEIWMATAYGAALYDPQSTEARWMALDATVPGSEMTYAIVGTHASSIVAMGPTTFLVNDGTVTTRVSVDAFSSDQDPTRTLQYTNGTAVLTDTTADIVESYDTLGRLVERRTRPGDVLFSVSYDGTSDRVTAITDPMGGATTFAYAGSALQTITDAAGHVTRVTVNGEGDLTSLQLPDGETYQFAYAAHRMTSKTSPKGDVTQYVYAADGTISQITKPGGEVTSLKAAFSQPATRDATGHAQWGGSYVDMHGVSHTFVLDANGQIASDAYTADGVAYTTTAVKPAKLGEWDDPHAQRVNNLLQRVGYTNINGLAVGAVDVWDEYGRLARRRKGDYGTGAYLDVLAFDANGRVVAYQGTPGNDHFNVEYDGNGRLARVYEVAGNGAPTGNETDVTWAAHALPATVTRHGVTTTFTYDTVTGNVFATSDTLGLGTSRKYDGTGNVIASFDGTTTYGFTYDANDRLTSVTDAANNTTTLGYVQTACGCSEASLVTSIHTPDLAPANPGWVLAYGAEGRLTSVTDPDGYAEQYAYETTGELRVITDRNGNTTTATHDQLGRVKAIVDALGRAHARAYPVPTASGWVNPSILTGSASATAATTSLTATTLTDGDYQIGVNGADAFAIGAGTRSLGLPQVSFYRDATMQVSYGHGWDDAPRETRVEDRTALPFSSTQALQSGTTGGYAQDVVTYSPNLPAPIVTSEESDYSGYYLASNTTYDAHYDITATTGFPSTPGGGTSTRYAFGRDAAGRLTSVDGYLSYAAGIPIPTLGFSYDSASRRTMRTRGLVQLGFAPESFIQETATYGYDARGFLSSIGYPATSQAYSFTDRDALGRSTRLTYPDGTVRVQQFDAEGRITSRCYTNLPNGASDRCYTAQYDPAGNPIVLGDPEGTDALTYDALNRVTSLTRNGVTETYEYNALGALKTNASQALDMRRPTTANASTLADSALPRTFAGAPVAVDPVGRITSLAGISIAYDKQGRVVTVNRPNVVSIAIGYDTFGRRVSTEYTWDSHVAVGGEIVGEYVIYDGAEPATTLRTTSTKSDPSKPDQLFLDENVFEGVDQPLGAAGQHVEMDLAGNIRKPGCRYTAFGTGTCGGGGWKGRPELMLGANAPFEMYDMRGRWWIPQIGAFLSADDFAYHDATSTLWGWPGANPLTFSDPSGHISVRLMTGLISESTKGEWENNFFGASVSSFDAAANDWRSGDILSANLNESIGLATALAGAATMLVPVRHEMTATEMQMALSMQTFGPAAAIEDVGASVPCSAANGDTVELRPYGGPGGGHHVPAKSAFRGAANYDLNKALAISNEELARLGASHPDITAAQMKGYRAFASTDQQLTWDAVRDIETDALINGGIRSDLARATVDRAIEALQAAGVSGPTRIPWGG